MPTVVGVRFKDSGKIYFFEPGQLEALAQGEQVIVETVRGLEMARVAYPPREVSEDEIVGELKSVVRRVEPADFERMRLLSARHDEVLARCGEKVREHGLPMRLVKAEYSFDGSRLTFYFTSERRVDFRMLVRDLARTFKTRIELRQIGPRDEAKLLGGIGPCGRLLCCATFLPDYARVSIKMAKDQDLPLNPSKISGVCGRLLCCLSYEHEQYLAIKAELPRKGAWVQTPDGPGEVVAVNVIKETVIVELAGSGVQEEFAPGQISEATRRVGEVARSRVEEGVAPGARRDRRDGAEPPRREAKHSGERRLLRDTIDDPNILDALALLEEPVNDPLISDALPGSLDTPRPARGEQPRRRQQAPRQAQQPHPPRPAQQLPTSRPAGRASPSPQSEQREEPVERRSQGQRQQDSRPRRRRRGA